MSRPLSMLPPFALLACTPADLTHPSSTGRSDGGTLVSCGASLDIWRPDRPGTLLEVPVLVPTTERTVHALKLITWCTSCTGLGITGIEETKLPGGINAASNG